MHSANARACVSGPVCSALSSIPYFYNHSSPVNLHSTSSRRPPSFTPVDNHGEAGSVSRRGEVYSCRRARRICRQQRRKYRRRFLYQRKGAHQKMVSLMRWTTVCISARQLMAAGLLNPSATTDSYLGFHCCTFSLSSIDPILETPIFSVSPST